jgi:hypothetical protein
LKLPEQSGRPKEQHDRPEDSSQQPPSGFARALHHRLNGFAALVPDQFLDLGGNLSLSGIVTEHDSRDAYDNHEERRQGENRIVGERRPKPWGFIRHPLRRCFLEYCPEIRHIAPKSPACHSAILFFLAKKNVLRTATGMPTPTLDAAGMSRSIENGLFEVASC